MQDSTLLLLANEVRGKTLRLLRDVTEEQALFTGHGSLSNSILWHAGHAITVVEALSLSRAEDRQPIYPPGWYNLFSWESKPVPTQDWPTLAEVTRQLQVQLVRLTDAIKHLTIDRLDQVIDAEKGRTLRYSILHGLHDEAGHQGEIHLLKKFWARR